MSQLLVTLFTFSFFALAFVGLMPVIAEENLAIDAKSSSYGILYACFGLGAALGAITVGTVFAQRSKVKLIRPGFVAFAVVLTAFAVLRDAAWAYPVSGLLGYAYFVVITSLSTVLQEHLEDSSARAGHGAVDHGLRRHRAPRRARRRLGGELRLDHDGGARRLRLGDRARGLVGSRPAAEEGGQSMAERHATAYREVRERTSALVRDTAPPEAMEQVAPATPEWRVRDVLAHLVGVTADVDRRPARRRRDRSVDRGAGRRAP